MTRHPPGRTLGRPGCRLDTAFKSETIDILKVDVEGAEPEAISAVHADNK
ncbi:MAG: hypothetical protein ACRDF4_01390 [Rhabdochlamydiaceae bacterium]